MSETKKTTKMTKSASGPPPDTQSLTLRIKDTMRDDLDLIAEYKNMLGATEMARGWIAEEIDKVKADRLYQVWLSRRRAPQEQAQLS